MFGDAPYRDLEEVDINTTKITMKQFLIFWNPIYGIKQTVGVFCVSIFTSTAESTRVGSCIVIAVSVVVSRCGLAIEVNYELFNSFL